MRFKLLAIACAVVLAGCASTGTYKSSEAALDKSPAVANVACSDIEYKRVVTDRFPEIDRACRGVVRDADGSPFIKVESIVHNVRRSARDGSVTRVTLDMLDGRGNNLRYLTVRPPRDFRFTVDGVERPVEYMARGENLRIYFPTDRWEVAWNIETAMPIDTSVFIEDIETFLVTSNLEADEAFAFNSADLTEGGRADLASIIEVAGDYVPSVTIFGYTDHLGAEDYNLDLSQRRADAARDYLIALGVPADRVMAVGRGEADPIVACKNLAGEGLKACLSPNRRAEVIFLIPAVADVARATVTKTYQKPLGEMVTVTEQIGVATLEEASGAADELLSSCAAEIKSFCGTTVAGDGRILGCLAANLQAGYDYSAKCDSVLLSVVDAIAYRRSRLNVVGFACSAELATCDAVPVGAKLQCVDRRPKSELCQAAMDLMATSAF